MTDIEGVAEKNWNAFTRAYDAGHATYVAEAKKFSDFYLSKQWDEKEKAALEATGKPALTFNEIQRVVNAIRGHYSTERADIVFKSKRPDDASIETSQSLTRLVDHLLEASGYHYDVEPQVFEDGIIEDRGYIDARISFEENVFGEVALTHLDPRTVVPDPDATDYDTSKWNELYIDRWMTLDDVELFYGKEKRDRLDLIAADPTMTFGQRSVKYDSFGDSDRTIPSDQSEHARVRAVRVIERQYRKLSQARELVDLRTGEFRPVPENWEAGRAEALVKEIPYLFLRKALRRRVRWTVSADHVELHDEWSPYPDFTVVAYFPMFRRGNPSGVVRHLIDPQTQLNKVESQVLHVINTTANSGWVVEAGSLVNMTEAELEQRGAETGLVLVFNRGKEPPQKIQPNTIPQGLEHFASKSRGYVQEISGASGLVGDQPTSEVSGVALDRTQSKSLTGLQVVFDNLTRTRRILANRILSLVQGYYTEQRVYHITDWRDPEQPQEELVINQQQAAGRIVNDMSIGEYEVTVSSVPARDTFEDTQFAQAIELRDKGVMIPDHHIILASHLAGKRKIAEEVKQLSGLGEPSEIELMMQEIQLQTAQAQLAEIQAKALKIEAEAQLNQAKAETEISGEERARAEAIAGLELEQQRLRADIGKKMADLQNKLQLAGIHSDAKSGLTRFTELMKANTKDKDRDATLQSALISAASSAQRKPPASSGGKS